MLLQNLKIRAAGKVLGSDLVISSNEVLKNHSAEMKMLGDLSCARRFECISHRGNAMIKAFANLKQAAIFPEHINLTQVTLLVQKRGSKSLIITTLYQTITILKV